MARLKTKDQIKIDKLFYEASDIYGNGNLIKAIDLLKKTWKKLPEPKFTYDESYHIARHATLICMEIKDFQQAMEWAHITKKCDPERQEIGEKEFLIGQVAYESGDMEEAKKYFELANEISDGLCFQEEDEKYKNLIK